MDDTLNITDENSSNFQSMMLSMGFKPPVLKNTKDMGFTEEELEEKRKSFINKKFDNSPFNILITMINSGKDYEISDIEEKLLLKYNVLDISSRKKFLKLIARKYHDNRIKIYSGLNGLYLQENIEKIKEESEKILHLIENNIAFRNIFNRIGINIENVTDTYKFNKYSATQDMIGVASLAYLQDIQMVCPQCGALTSVQNVNFDKLFHKHSNDFILALHGKLLQDCTSCDWYYYYDIDALTDKTDSYKKIISEESKFSIKRGETQKISNGITSKDYIKFLLPIENDILRAELFKKWKENIGTKRIPKAKNEKNSKNKFSAKNYLYVEGEKEMVGLEFGPVINDFVLVTIYLGK